MISVFLGEVQRAVNPAGALWRRLYFSNEITITGDGGARLARLMHRMQVHLAAA